MKTALVTGHHLLQPSAPDAPLEFTFEPGDAELLARCDAAVSALRMRNASAVSDLPGVRYEGGASLAAQAQGGVA